MFANSELVQILKMAPVIFGKSSAYPTEFFAEFDDPESREVVTNSIETEFKSASAANKEDARFRQLLNEIIAGQLLLGDEEARRTEITIEISVDFGIDLEESKRRLIMTNDAFRRIDELATLTENHDDEGAEIVKHSAITAAKIVANNIIQEYGIEIEPPSALSDGGVEIELENDIWYVGLWIYSKDNIHCIMERGEQRFEGVLNITELQDSIESVIAR